MDDEILDIHGAAAFLKLSRATIYQKTRTKKIPFHKPSGKKLIFFKRELEKWAMGKLRK